MVTIKQFQDHFRKLLNTKAIYLWGANCETISQKLCDNLYKSYGSATYTKEYYDKKLKEGLGKIGADCSGSYCPISGFDATARTYYNRCAAKGPISEMPTDIPVLLFNATFTHTGAYLGDGTTIEMRSSVMNVYSEKLNRSRWAYYGLPAWIDYTSEREIESGKGVDIANNIMMKIITMIPSEKQDAVRGTRLSNKDIFNSIRTLTMALQATLNKERNAGLVVDGYMGPKTKAACEVYSSKTPGLNKSNIVYLIQAALYVRGYSMDGNIENNDLDGQYGKNTAETVLEFQQDARGLRLDGIAGPATIYSLFKF